MLRLMQGSQTSQLNNLFSISPPYFHTLVLLANLL
uniref:Uncharacterized protein n=1 Tax=Anguilla anguilla TaxID=7936 RepID=A0A0E9UKZ1_ANGAN